MTMAKEVYSTESIGETVSEAAADIAANALSAECWGCPKSPTVNAALTAMGAAAKEIVGSHAGGALVAGAAIAAGFGPMSIKTGDLVVKSGLSPDEINNVVGQIAGGAVKGAVRPQSFLDGAGTILNRLRELVPDQKRKGVTR